MSTAHRPTWDPAQAREVKGGSRQFSSRDMAAHTKLKFRQPGQTSTSDVSKRDLRAELLLAEHDARNKKRKAAGQPPLPFLAIGGGAAPQAIEAAPTEDEDVDMDGEASKRRKILADALEMDRDDSDDESAAGDKPGATDGEKTPAAAADEDDDSDDESDDEDETAVLLRELEKIKRERAADKARQDAAASAVRDADVATANPLLNLAAALGAETPAGVSTTVPGTFAVKRRWDDDLIFKNQALGQKDRSGEFVNDLLRTEFHRKFMAKFIKVCSVTSFP